ncbi:MAG: hypothetical protein Q7S22_01600 [Candidatus Micrarchaeota archaeon]|nr:hypothetical protein [Candidatus Micrarchaeota archaeon]
MGETFKSDEKVISKEKESAPQKRFTHLLEEDQTEVKRLTLEDVEDAVAVMRRCAFDVTDKEVSNIIEYGVSFGCYVNRMLIGVGLAWPAHLNLKEKKIMNGDINALYMEDPAVLLSYEGRGIRRILVQTRENDAKTKNHKYVIAYLSEDLPVESISDYITESGTQLEKLYLSENYTFSRTERGIMALKEF